MIDLSATVVVCVRLLHLLDAGEQTSLVVLQLLFELVQNGNERITELAQSFSDVLLSVASRKRLQRLLAAPHLHQNNNNNSNNNNNNNQDNIYSAVSVHSVHVMNVEQRQLAAADRQTKHPSLSVNSGSTFQA